MLRLVDCDEKSVMGYTAHPFRYTREKIMENFLHNEKDYKPIHKIVDKCWTLHLDRPLLDAGVFLNPCVYYIERENEVSCADLYESAFQDVTERMVKNKEECIQIMLGVEAYKQRSKFDSERTTETIEFLQPSMHDFFRK